MALWDPWLGRDPSRPALLPEEEPRAGLAMQVFWYFLGMRLMWGGGGGYEAKVVLGYWTVFPSAVGCQMCVCLLTCLLA